MQHEQRTFSIDPEQVPQFLDGTLDLTGLDTAEKLELYLHW